MQIQAKRRLTFAVAILATLSLVGFALAGAAKVKKHNHHDAHGKSAEHLKHDGNHVLEKNGKHTVSVDVKNGKIAKFHAKHDTKGEVAVKKYKSRKKMASLETDPSEGVPAQQVDEGTVWVAYAYVDDEGNEEYYWYQAEEIYDGDTGATEYVPLS